eukprot:4213704-Pleurochrysis_carterae.AAC.1
MLPRVRVGQDGCAHADRYTPALSFVPGTGACPSSKRGAAQSPNSTPASCVAVGKRSRPSRLRPAHRRSNTFGSGSAAG